MCDLSYLQRKSSRVENYRNLSYDSFPPTEKHMLEVKK